MCLQKGRGIGLALCVALPVALSAQIVDQWRYTLEAPQGPWQTAAYDDASWKKGTGGFGTVGTPGARVGTVWRTKTIWLRKRVPLAAALKKPALLVHHDEDAEIYLNGQRVMALTGFRTDYGVFPLADEHRALTTERALHGLHAKAAPVAKILVDFDNLAYHKQFLASFLL